MWTILWSYLDFNNLGESFVVNSWDRFATKEEVKDFLLKYELDKDEDVFVICPSANELSSIAFMDSFLKL